MDILKVNGSGGWFYSFRKLPNRPIEIKKTHEELGDLGCWQVAKNFCLKALIIDSDLARHFGMSEFDFKHGISSDSNC